MNPDNTLGGHQWTKDLGLDNLPMEQPYATPNMDTDTYYVQRRMPSTRHGGSESVVHEFVVARNCDLVIINGSERMNKVCARMRWNYLMKEGWKQTYE